MSEIPTEHVEWCRNVFRALNEGGVWGVPRSGLVFTKRGEELVLTERLPASVEQSRTYQGEDLQLRAYQDEDFEVIKAHFAAAGITVTEAVTS